MGNILEGGMPRETWSEPGCQLTIPSLLYLSRQQHPFPKVRPTTQYLPI